ncbi:uncharacterized protein LOC119835229 [Zerene cesonia]|uniref:uncharacterized protein LOC119835229 n=1 Tax=Zerene cesonia TaxID=33412 RepID=UPI0018E54781|nr:uncharacterized protein LOC119835229 [Zerene cesonia]
MQLVVKIRLFRSPFTICYITEHNVILPDEHSKCIGINFASGDQNYECNKIHIENENKLNRKTLGYKTTALFLQPFLRECVYSDVYRRNIIRYLNEISGNSGTVFFKLILEPPDKEVIDYIWNDRVQHLLRTRIEIENAFAWLSTLGGAYSALGDYFEHCAEEAGRISIKQYRLSKMLGDESLCARSRLYLALAYSQKGNLKLSRHIVRSVADFARITNDKRLNRMCQGVWAKLKYLRQLKKNSELNNVNGTTESVARVMEVNV